MDRTKDGPAKPARSDLVAREAFAGSGFWQAGRGFFSPPVDEGALPGSLLERFLGDWRAKLLGLLRWLSPITPPPAQVF